MTYDGSGNRTGGSYGVTTGNEMSADASWTYQYDKEGNLTEKDTTAGGSSEKWTYAWSADNKLAEVKHYDSAGSLALTVDYRYDAFGELIQKDDGTYVTKYGVDGWNPNMSSPIGNENFDVWADLNGGSSSATRYLRGDVVDQILARIDKSGSTLKPYWGLTDHLGSVRDVIDNSGVVVDSLKYDSFGNIDDGTELDAAYRGRYTWTGREFDVETQLQFNRARYYDAGTGRWISQDPLGFDAGDSNLYRYVNNRATVATDPSGLQGPADNKDFVEFGRFIYETFLKKKSTAPKAMPAAQESKDWKLSATDVLPIAWGKWGTYARGLNWKLDKGAGSNGGAIIQRVKSKYVIDGKTIESDYIEAFEIEKGKTTYRNTNPIPGSELDDTLERLEKAGFEGDRLKNVKQARANDWNFALTPTGSTGKMEREMTAVYVDGLTVADLLKIGFERERVRAAGDLLAIPVESEKGKKNSLVENINEKMLPHAKDKTLRVSSNVFQWKVTAEWTKDGKVVEKSP